jgi:solute carrier family 20 (sodium-dependent phosphate transporter)
MSGSIEQYLWIAILGGIGGFAYGFLIGANDVANAFASSVASKSVTLKQAVIIASIFEFSGAFFLGASVTSTIRSKIVDSDLYESQPDILMLGMFSALVSANIMLYIATHFGMPVSTTHDIVGSIMGFSIAAKGFDSIHWDVATKIFMSWVASPLLAGTVGAILFACVKFGIMRSEHPYTRAYNTFPIVITVGLGIDIFYVLYKASSNFKSFTEETLDVRWVVPASFGAGAFVGLLWLVIFGPIARKRTDAARAKRELEALEAEKRAEAAAEAGLEGSDDPKVVEDDEPARPVGALAKFSKAFADNTYKQDLEKQSFHESPGAQKIWDQGEVFDQDAESMFSYIQVFTACLNSFAHGANDVSNTIAPLSAIIQIYQDGVVNSKATVQKWVLAYGGIAIVLGLLLYGYRVMKSLGYKLTMLSPSRGACAELAASFTVVTASFLELPVSSTQCIVGAVCGVGLVGGTANLEWKFLVTVLFGWVTLFFSAVILAAGVFSMFAFSPSLTEPVIPEL